ncbi:hypothetical protein ACFL5O_09705, partial [Myxococcota bacterium]
EDSYYELLEPPYHRKNAAFDSLEEVHMVRGVSDDFWATFVDPDPADPKKRVLTVWGSGKINLNTVNPQTLMSIVCSHATPETSPCTDPTQMANLVGMLAMVRAFTPGIPILGTPKGFTRLVTGNRKDALGSLLFTFLPDFKPIVFRSESEFIHQFVQESSVFSMYAVGRVKSGRRETRVRIHAVVDFRGAPPPGLPRRTEDLTGALQPDVTSGIQSADASSQQNDEELPEGASEDSIAAALKPSPAGHVIYYRVD